MACTGPVSKSYNVGGGRVGLRGQAPFLLAFLLDIKTKVRKRWLLDTRRCVGHWDQEINAVAHWNQRCCFNQGVLAANLPQRSR